MSEIDLTTFKKNFRLPESAAGQVLGQHDSHINRITAAFGTTVAFVGGELTVRGDESGVVKTIDILAYLLDITLERPVVAEDVANAIRMAMADDLSHAKDIAKDKVKVAGAVKYVYPKTMKQKEYLRALREKDMVFAYGPAGTGKTFLAVAMAVHMYLEKRVRRIVLTRPAVEAGEKLGFLPGDLSEKINPYLRPLYDALYAMMDAELVDRLLEQNIIEVAPLAFMRGRTLSNAFIILDEAQNTTTSQMKMFLTRLGFGSTAIITGDTTQIDIAEKDDSGLMSAIKALSHLEEIGIVELSDKDVVRHPLVTKIINAYK